jgi:hypothetical protein
MIRVLFDDLWFSMTSTSAGEVAVSEGPETSGEPPMRYLERYLAHT